MRETTRGALPRLAAVAGWVAGCEVMIVLGAVLQGVAGAWVAGGALYLIMSREWSRQERRCNYGIHLPVLAGTALVGIVTEVIFVANGAAGLTLYWEQLPLAIVLLGALYNYDVARRASPPPVGQIAAE